MKVVKGKVETSLARSAQRKIISLSLSLFLNWLEWQNNEHCGDGRKTLFIATKSSFGIVLIGDISTLLYIGWVRVKKIANRFSPIIIPFPFAIHSLTISHTINWTYKHHCMQIYTYNQKKKFFGRWKNFLSYHTPQVHIIYVLLPFLDKVLQMKYGKENRCFSSENVIVRQSKRSEMDTYHIKYNISCTNCWTFPTRKKSQVR